MGKRGKERDSRTRLRKGSKKQVSNLNSARTRSIKEALDAVYATESSEVGRFLVLAQHDLFDRREW